MSLPKGIATKKLVDAINSAIGETSGVQAADITDASTVGKTLLTAATAAAQRTALGDLKEFVAAPATASSAGSAGQWAVDATAIYVCTATNTWVKTALATW